MSKKPDERTDLITKVECSKNYVIKVYEGSISKNDIKLKYKKPKKRERTPKHVHWAADLLAKKTKKPRFTGVFLDSIAQYWNSCSVLEDRTNATIKNVVDQIRRKYKENKETYSKLDSYGEYSTDFLYILMCLLALQEKTNAQALGKEAYFFKKVLDELSEPLDELDIYQIFSPASYSGKNKRK